MQIGLYLHRIEFGVWRVVSEDSDHFRSLVDLIDEVVARRGLKNIPRHRQNR